jgi:hypothetical protein
MAWQGRPDPAVTQWWADISCLVAERSRSVAAGADDVEKLCDV